MAATTHVDDEDMEEMQQIWKHVVPNETLQQMLQGNPVNKRPRSNQNPSQKDRRDGNQNRLLQLMARLMLRQEATLAVLTVEHQFVLHMGTGAEGAIPTLMAQSQEWRQATAKRMPLRHQLVCCMMKQYHQRVVKLTSSAPDSDFFKACVKQGLLTNEKTLPYLTWCQKQKKLIPNGKVLTAEELLQILQEMEKLLEDPAVTLRFHALRKLTAEANQVPQMIPWLWAISSRTNASLWRLIQKLCFHGAWQLLQIRLKPQSLQRSALANQIAKHL